MLENFQEHLQNTTAHPDNGVPDDGTSAWKERIAGLYADPFLTLMHKAAIVHAAHWPSAEIERCTLLSLKTGHCPEDCAYCPQSARHETHIPEHDLLDVETIVERAKVAQANGSRRFCMGAAWRKPPRGKQFEQVCEAVGRVKKLGMETCVTLGMLTTEQAHKLKEAGLDFYNHNVDSSPAYYGKIITTRTFADRVKTLRAVRSAALNVCCGGILGMGESPEDRIALLAFLASMSPQPESVPINLLVKVAGTPLAATPDIDPLEVVRTIAVARIAMPRTRLRLSAGRMQMTREMQILCFLAGANSIFTGEKLLTTPLPGSSFDDKLLRDITQGQP